MVVAPTTVAEKIIASLWLLTYRLFAVGNARLQGIVAVLDASCYNVFLNIAFQRPALLCSEFSGCL